MDIKHYYNILGLETGCSQEELKQAYRDLVKIWHPDRFPDNPRLKEKAENQLMEINQAYEKVLAVINSKHSIFQSSHFRHKKSGESDSSGSKRPKKKGGREKASETQPHRQSVASIATHPWIRCLARSIDYLLFGLLLGIMNIYSLLSEIDIPVIILISAGTFTWIIFEAAFLCLFGTTPGKLFLNTGVVDAHGKKLPFLNALKRSFFVWFKGLGLGLIFIFPITMLIAYHKLKNEKTASWDRMGQFTVTHGKIDTSRGVLVASFIIIYSFIYYQVVNLKNRNDIQHTPYGQQEIADTLKVSKKPENTENTYEPKDQEKFTHKKQQPATLNSIEWLQKAGALWQNGTYTDPGQAIVYLNKAIRIDRNNADAYISRGKAHSLMDQFEKAIEDFSLALALNPNDAETYKKRGYLYKKLGMHHEAIKDYDRALRIGLKNSYFEYIKKEFGKCRNVIFCKADHNGKLILETLINKYNLCEGRCDDLKLLPDGLRYVGLDGTARLIENVLNATDTYYSSIYEKKALGEYDKNEADVNYKKISEQIVYLTGRQYGEEEQKIISFIDDYDKLSEKLYRKRLKVIPVLVAEQKRLKEKVLAEQKKIKEEVKEHARLIKSGEEPVKTFNDATIYYNVKNGLSLLLHPPLPPLSEKLRSQYFVVRGSITGIHEMDGIYYNVDHQTRDGIYYFRFRLADHVPKPDFRVGQNITLIGRLTDSAHYVTKAKDFGQIPVFEAVYLKSE